jgi:hypothetical protein
MVNGCWHSKYLNSIKKIETLIIQFNSLTRFRDRDNNCSVGNVLCIMYAPFTKNRREIVTMQKNDVLGFISFEKADPAPEGYISKDIYPLIYILKSPKKDISHHFLEKDILGI